MSAPVNIRFYHYITKGNDALKRGILSFAKNPDADLSYYYKRSGATTHAGVVKWLESCFAGRSRGIRGFSEPIKWTKDSLSLKTFIENADLFSIDVTALAQDGLLETVYVSPSIMDTPNLTEQTDCDEVLIKLPALSAIDLKPVDWTVCNDALGRRFAFVPYYLLVMKDGLIPPEYIGKE